MPESLPHGDFIIDASKVRGISGAPLAFWALGFVFFGEGLFVAYWWLLYVVRDRRPEAAAAPSAGLAGG